MRLEVPRRGPVGWLAPRPVLKAVEEHGNKDDWLTVSKSYKWAARLNGAITVREASEKAYRWYRLSRSLDSLFSAVASIIGALLVALGALDSTSVGGSAVLSLVVYLWSRR